MNTKLNRRHMVMGIGIASLLALGACAPLPGIYQARRAGNPQTNANPPQNRGNGNAQVAAQQPSNGNIVCLFVWSCRL